MAKLGESRLGSTEFATPSEFIVDSDIDEAVRERAEDVMKSVYPTHSGTNWDKILDMSLFEFKREHEVIEDIVSGRFIDDATGEQLDKIGSLWQIERRTQEDDGHLRARIKAQLPRHTSEATIEEVIRSSAALLNTDESRIHVSETHWHDWYEGVGQYDVDDFKTGSGGYATPDGWDGDEIPESVYDETSGTYGESYGDEYRGTGGELELESWIANQKEAYPWEPARFDVVIEEIVFHTAGIEIDDYEELLQDIKPAGVRALATIGEQFTYRSVEDADEGINNPEKAYGGYDDDTMIGYDREADEPLSSPIDLSNEPEAEYAEDLGGVYADEISRQFTP